MPLKLSPCVPNQASSTCTDVTPAWSVGLTWSGLVEDLLAGVRAEEEDIDEVRLRELRPPRVPCCCQSSNIRDTNSLTDKGSPLVLGDDGVGGGEARDDGVARVELAVGLRLADLGLVCNRLSRTQRAAALGGRGASGQGGARRARG